MDYTLETAHRLAEELRAIPAKDPSQRRLDKQGMVKHLAQEIVALQQRGYTIEEVAESLRGRGLEITTPTLKNYLQRAKSTSGKRSKARRPTVPPRPKAEPSKATAPSPPTGPPPAKAVPESSPRVAEAAPRAEMPPEPGLRSGKGAFLIKDKESY
jgi:hypothetical protein